MMKSVELSLLCQTYPSKSIVALLLSSATEKTLGVKIQKKYPDVRKKNPLSLVGTYLM